MSCRAVGASCFDSSDGSHFAVELLLKKPGTILVMGMLTSSRNGGGYGHLQYYLQVLLLLLLLAHPIHHMSNTSKHLLTIKLIRSLAALQLLLGPDCNATHQRLYELVVYLQLHARLLGAVRKRRHLWAHHQMHHS